MKERFCNKSNLIILAAFLIPALTITAVYAGLDFYPFGDKSVLIMDMSGQYVEFFASLRHAFGGDGSLLFSWSRSMGGNFVGLFAYYLASPLSFLTLFFSLENLPSALFLLTILKTGLCGMTFAVYLEYEWNARKGRGFTVAFSCCYALMSYAVVYGMCLMWLDGLIFLPLVLLGIEKLLKGQKGIIFLLSLTGVFICNYYTAYMVGIFAAIYILYRFFCIFSKKQWKKVFHIFLRFAGNTVLAFGISAPLILPTAKDLLSGKLSMEQYIPEGPYNFELWYLIRRMFGGAFDGITNSGSPSIFCGSLVVVLVVLFFFLKKISWKEKIGAAVILSFMVISFWIVKLDMAWHGFQYPTWFPYRYAFVFSTFMLLVAGRAVKGIELSVKAKEKLRGPFAVYLTAIAVLFQYVEIYYNAKENITGLDQQFRYNTMEEYQSYMAKYQMLVEDVKERDDGFYRMEKDTEFSKNDSMALGYNGMTHYSSTFHAGVNEITKELGIAQAHIWNSGYGSTALTDSIFNVKYRMMEAGVPGIYKKLEEKEGVSVYENTKVLPIAFASGEIDLMECSGNSFENQNFLFNQLAQTESIEYFKPVEYKEEQADGLNWQYLLTAEDSDPLYLRIFGNYGNGRIYADQKYVGSHFSNETNCNLFIGEFAAGEEVKILCETSDVVKSGELLYKLDMDAFNKAYESLSRGGLQVTRHKGSTIEGTIKVGSNQMIFTSIPYDEGFSVKVDGKTVETAALQMKKNGRLLDTFLIIPAEKGEHEIVISYMPPGLTAGICLAAMAILLTIGYYKGETLKSRFLRNKAQKQIGE